MKGTRILMMLLLAFGLIGWPAKLVGAVPMGTAFTYQGHLMDDKLNPVKVPHDFWFSLYDDPTAGDANEIDMLQLGFADVPRVLARRTAVITNMNVRHFHRITQVTDPFFYLSATFAYMQFTVHNEPPFCIITSSAGATLNHDRMLRYPGRTLI